MNLLILSIALFLNSFINQADIKSKMQGAWRSDEGIAIISGNYFAYTVFTRTNFINTYGGTWTVDGSTLKITYEFNTENPALVGTSTAMSVRMEGNSMVVNDGYLTRIDDGNPGKLEGAWLFSNRMRDGAMGTPRNADNPRKTMKILSGTRFQWIAYNVETKEFMGTGGGTYTTVDRKYTENIDFFSRDNSRVGASLEFDFERKGDDWHHKGFSSKGDPMHEVWSLRE